MNERKVLEVTYTAFDASYQNASLRYIRGFQDADSTTPTAGTLDDPRSAVFPVRPDVRDTKVFSFAYRGEVRFLVCKIFTSQPGEVSQIGRWSMLMAPTPPLGAWATLARDIVFKDKAGNYVLSNPYGLTQVGHTLYLAEYDTKKVWRLGDNEINGLDDKEEHTLTEDPLDLSGKVDADAKGQAIIALKPASGSTSVFVLFTVSTVDSTNPAVVIHYPGILVRLTVGTGGALTFSAMVTVGKNPLELVPITDGNGLMSILITAVGDMQKAGVSNGVASNISCVPAFGDWSDYEEEGAPVLITGDPDGAYDFHAVGVSYRADSAGVVYILTLIYAEDYAGTNWNLYKTNVSYLLSLSEVTISEALNPTNFTLIDYGTEDPGWFWELLYETGSDATKDRLWFVRGSAILACPALAYPPAHPVNPVPPDASYRYFNIGERDGDIGGANIDWIDLSVETVNQIAAGHSLKRSIRATVPAGAVSTTEDD
jgi:hypothetical protein